MIPDDSGKFEHKRAYKANKRTDMFDVKFIPGMGGHFK